MNVGSSNFNAIRLGVFLLAAAALPLRAQLIFTDFGGNPSLAIPDGIGSGVSDTRTVSSPITSIGSITVSLEISGQFNGDLYAYLRKDDAVLSVLLNRTGRTLSSSSGYDGTGFNLTLDDTAVNGDIHLYRNSAGYTTDSPLTGIWQPDGRATDPATVLDTYSDRSANLSVFNELNANGQWTLFLADVESGGTHSLESWGMQITAVPEPRVFGLVIGIGLTAFAVVRRWRSRRPVKA